MAQSKTSGFTHICSHGDFIHSDVNVCQGVVGKACEKPTHSGVAPEIRFWGTMSVEGTLRDMGDMGQQNPAPNLDGYPVNKMGSKPQPIKSIN